jgi:hypothetical protein
MRFGVAQMDTAQAATKSWLVGSVSCSLSSVFGCQGWLVLQGQSTLNTRAPEVDSGTR